MLVLALTPALRWWRPVLTENTPVRRWVSVVPVIMAVAMLVSINYGGPANRGLGFALVRLVAVLVILLVRRTHIEPDER